jgi:hypothetical protein
MAYNDQYGLFEDDGKGPMWRDSFTDLEQAKIQGQKLANKEQVTFFIYCFHRFREVARFKPAKKLLTQPKPQSNP